MKHIGQDERNRTGFMLGCEREHNCPMRERYYVASGAQANYRGVLVNCRSGVHPDEETVRRMSDVLTPAARRGQSVDAGNAELFGKYARSASLTSSASCGFNRTR